MSSNPERKPEDEEGTMIPVFTVIKNGVILKNIFVVNKPPEHFSGLSSIKFVENSENPDHDSEEILIVGRHPDCNIVLMHPSISRFHLQINSNPSLRKLFVTDLSSVHGTWVSEKNIDPGFRVELKEGDTIRIGGSTRVYRLHWVPLNRAYDSANPFVSESDLALIHKKEEENIETMSQNEDLLTTENNNVEEKNSLVVLEEAEETNEGIDSFVSDRGETQSVDSILEDVVSLFPDENAELILKKEIPSSMSMRMNPFHGGKEEIENSSTNDHELSLKSVGGVILQTLGAIFYDCNQSPEYHFAEEDIDISMMTRLELESHVEVSSDFSSSFTEVDSASKITKETRSQSLPRKENEQTIDTLPPQSVPLSMPEGEPSDTYDEYVNKENQNPEDLPASNTQCEEENGGNTADNKQLNEQVNLQSGSSDDTAATEVLEETENHSPLRKESLLREPTFDDLAAIEVLEETENQSPLRKEGILNEPTIDDPAATEVLEETKAQSSIKKEGILTEQIIDDPAAIEVLEETEILIGYRKEGILNEPTIDDSATIEVFEETENQSPLRKEGILRGPTFVPIAHLEREESPNSPMPLGEVLSQSRQCQTPKSNFPQIENLENMMGSCNRSGKRTGSGNIWSRRGKPASALQLQTSRSQRKTRGGDEWENQENLKSKSIRKDLFSDLESMFEEVYTPDKEKCTPNTSIMRSLKKNVDSRSTTRALFSDLEAMEEEVFTSNKENCTPNTCILRSRKKSNIDLEENMFTSSDKENQTPAILQERKSARPSRHHFKLEEDIVLKERRAERVPLRSLISNSPVRLSEVSFPSAAERSNSISCNQKVTNSNSVNSVGDGRRRWIMIADTTSLLNKETRGALQLLQGLKGTHLIIPRIVIRELDSLKRCNSLFRRKTEASVVLQWIEECMLKTKWWIHVQSSVEDVRPIAPTPPATPVSQFREGSEVFPFSAQGTPLELVSPTAEDHILDCALFYKKTNNDRHLALLSNNVTLKIKALAEGLICETAQEFRDSLVNPFSERFLWADSSPRGQTWSVFDDVVLKEKYYRSPSKKSSRGESAKGLKLILLHNSQYVKSI